MTTDEREALKQQLIRHEGLRLTVYRDSVGVETIGVGRNLRGKGISAAEAMILLDHDIDECEADLQTFDWYAALDPVRQRAVLDFRFNLGSRTFRTFRRFLTGLAARDYALAARSMRESKWFTQVQKDRSDRLIRQVLTGEDA